MYKTTSATLIAVVLALPALAMDSDGDGMVTQAEFQAAMPDAPSGTFEQLDADGDGALNEAEVAAGRDAGIIPA
ncbi:MAG: EF-hand domain-containing protein [Pseudomonadota bacterium]